MTRKIEVQPYDPTWPALFRKEAERLRPMLGNNLAGLHHIGSTAVPGLAAKPTIDILIVVRSHTRLDACCQELESLGYSAKGENGIPGRRYFQRLAGEDHLFHLHAYEDGHPDIRRHLDFRDFLRVRPETARAYAALKQSLMAQYTYEPKLYTEGKSEFIQLVDRQAAAWRAASQALTGAGNGQLSEDASG